ncbi:Cation/H+ exchanger, partial [Gamsiella multidivaricata]|uniref:Cation/H+ exchanger n=1 Tax=Gamsiella multidivaricata TaxID=101098 RepID=UPI00221F51DC
MTASIVLEASPEHIAYALLGCFIIVFGLVSLFVKEKLFISEAFVSTVFGIIIGPYAIGIFDPLGWQEFDQVTLEFTRIVIAVQVMAAGVSLPRAYIVKERLSLFMMIVPLMVLMWCTSALLIWGLIPNLGFVEAMVIAACVTPTDPVLSNSVVKGRFAEKHVPPRIRYLLSAESGINDGMGLPFLFLGLYLLREQTAGVAIAKWFYLVWAYQILLSIIIGGIIGFAARKLVKGAKNRKLIDKESFLVFSIALALAVAGIVSILASDDLLACFICGNIFAWDDWFSNEIAEAHIQEIIDMLLNLACFVYIGASIPFSSFGDPALGLTVWRMIILAVVVLMFRRLPFVIALKPLIPALTTYREAAFAGWFGPIGVGAVFFSKVTAMLTHPEHIGEDAHNLEKLNRVRAVIFPVVMFLVFSSVLIHGVTVPLLHL